MPRSASNFFPASPIRAALLRHPRPPQLHPLPGLIARNPFAANNSRRRAFRHCIYIKMCLLPFRLFVPISTGGAAIVQRLRARKNTPRSDVPGFVISALPAIFAANGAAPEKYVPANSLAPAPSILLIFGEPPSRYSCDFASSTGLSLASLRRQLVTTSLYSSHSTATDFTYSFTI